MSPLPDDQRKTFTCEQCREVFVSEEARQEHLESCFPCDLCGQIFRKHYLLTTHMFGCMRAKGEVTFTHRHNLDTDMTSHTSEEVSSGESGNYIEDNSNLPDNKQERNKTDEYKRCDETHDESGHIESDLREQDSPTTSDSGKDLGNSLQINSRMDIANEYFTEDLIRQGSDAPFKCNIKNKHSLDEHMDLHTGEKPHQCFQCEQGFTTHDQLTNHMRRHSPKKLYICVKCGKGFSRELNMSIDMKLHIECLECAKKLASDGNLTHHMGSHTGEKAHMGDICGQSFNSTDYLTKHMIIRTKEKLYECSDCGKCFKGNWFLNRHMNTHTGEKPHKCDVCDKHFAQSYYLAEHMRIHTGEKLYKCNECGKCFRTSSLFAAHKRTHTGEKPYSCPVCGKAFRQHSSYAYHMKKQHGE